MREAPWPAGEPFLAGAIARRFAHDLAGPLAALVTMFELSPEADPLMAEAIAEMHARLSLFRLLFGGEPDAAFDGAAARELLSAHLQARRHSLQAELPAAPRAARGMLLLALAASDLVSGAGQISVQPARVQASGQLRAATPELLAALEAGTSSDPGLAAAACAAALLGPVAMARSETGLVFSVRHP